MLLPNKPLKWWERKPLLNTKALKLYMFSSTIGIVMWLKHSLTSQSIGVAVSLNLGYIFFLLGGIFQTPELVVASSFLIIYGNLGFVKQVNGDTGYSFSKVASLLIIILCLITFYLLKTNTLSFLIPLVSLIINGALVSIKTHDQNWWALLNRTIKMKWPRLFIFLI